MYSSSTATHIWVLRSSYLSDLPERSHLLLPLLTLAQPLVQVLPWYLQRMVKGWKSEVQHKRVDISQNLSIFS